MRIKELTIYSSQLEQQVEFYTSILSLNCIEQSEKEASFQIGDSTLTIVYQENATPYHFAINIPSNKENEALKWLKERVETLKDGNTELHDFDFWNAKAMYFYDPDHNIVEFIARKNLNNETQTPFNSSQLLSISEIGLVSTDITTNYQALVDISGIEIFSGNFERMLALGDDHGLFICIDKSNKNWFPQGDEAHISDFEVSFMHRERNCRIKYQNGQLVDLS